MQPNWKEKKKAQKKIGKKENKKKTQLKQQTWHQITDHSEAITCSYLRSLASFGTRPEILETQWESNSLAMVF